MIFFANPSTKDNRHFKLWDKSYNNPVNLSEEEFKARYLGEFISVDPASKEKDECAICKMEGAEIKWIEVKEEMVL